MALVGRGGIGKGFVAAVADKLTLLSVNKISVIRLFLMPLFMVCSPGLTRPQLSMRVNRHYHTKADHGYQHGTTAIAN
jgi:hypothetical protein